jgi:hypothetical protein
MKFILLLVLLMGYGCSKPFPTKEIKELARKNASKFCKCNGSYASRISYHEFSETYSIYCRNDTYSRNLTEHDEIHCRRL